MHRRVDCAVVVVFTFLRRTNLVAKGAVHSTAAFTLVSFFTIFLVCALFAIVLVYSPLSSRYSHRICAYSRCPHPLRGALATTACSCRRLQGEADEALTCLVNKKDESEL